MHVAIGVWLYAFHLTFEYCFKCMFSESNVNLNSSSYSLIDNFSVVYWFILCIFGADESRKLFLDQPKLKLQMYIESTGWPQTPKEFEGTIMTFTYLSTESLFF